MTHHLHLGDPWPTIRDYILPCDIIHDYRVMAYDTDTSTHSQHEVHRDNILLINETEN